MHAISDGGIPLRLPASTPLFTVPFALFRILDKDLVAAGIDKRDDHNRTIDVHALRHTFGTLLSRGGTSLRTAQSAMRHSDPSLTANVYVDPRLLDVAGALDSLPSLPIEQASRERIYLRKTGTDGALGRLIAGGSGPRLAPTLAPNGGKCGESESFADDSASEHATTSDSGAASKKAAKQGEKRVVDAPDTCEDLERAKRLELSTFSLGSRALQAPPNCDFGVGGVRKAISPESRK